MKKEQNHWLSERSKLFAKYAEGLPKNSSYVQVSLDPPKYGMIDMHLCVNYKEKGLLTPSADTDEPFDKIKRWLEDIVTSSTGVSWVTIDCDPELVTLCFEPILYWDGYNGHAYRDGYCGIFYVYDSALNNIMFDTLCTAEDLVKSLYNSIINYAEEMRQNDDVIENWVLHEICAEDEGLEEDSPELKKYFLKDVKSDVIENYLGIKL
jgi:hypothetical protein